MPRSPYHIARLASIKAEREQEFQLFLKVNDYMIRTIDGQVLYQRMNDSQRAWFVDYLERIDRDLIYKARYKRWLLTTRRLKFGYRSRKPINTLLPTLPGLGT